MEVSLMFALFLKALYMMKEISTPEIKLFVAVFLKFKINHLLRFTTNLLENLI